MLALSAAPAGLTVAEATATVHVTTGRTDCTIRQAAYDLRRLRGKSPKGLVVAVDGGPVRGFATEPGTADSGQDGGDELVAEGEQGGDDAGGGRG